MADYHSIVISYDHNIIAPNGWSHCRSKNHFKNGMYHFYPSAKSRIELIIKTSGVICRGASAHHVQKAIAPPKRHFLEKKNQLENVLNKTSSKSFFGRRKIECRESSETRFPKVSRRTEPSSGCKRLFKVCKNLFGVEQWNVGNPLKRVLAKFRANRSHVRGANGRSKR